jgi:hypothetical protein
LIDEIQELRCSRELLELNNSAAYSRGFAIEAVFVAFFA